MNRSARIIDHCVLPTADLAVARQRLSKLGFTVSPNGMHPFGTENCCVYLTDGTFFEPLAVADMTMAGEAITAGNVFVARDRVWRERRGQEGFSALVFSSDDADADHRSFVAAKFSAGDRLDFTRPFVDASGKSDEASFRLAFAADPRVPDSYFFACERANAPAVDRSALQQHANGVKRIKAVVVQASDSADFVPLLTAVVGVDPHKKADRFVFPAQNGQVILQEVEGPATPADMKPADIVFGCEDLGLVERTMQAGGVDYLLRDHGVCVPSAPGQGANFLFEEL